MEQKPHRTTRASAKVDAESVRLAMDLACRGHRHILDQVGKATLLQVVLAGGLLAVDLTIDSALVTAVFGLAVVAVIASGLFTALRARDLEMGMIARIHKCEEALGLHRDDLLPAEADRDPKPLCLRDIFRMGKHSGFLLMLRIQAAVLLFVVLCILVRVWGTAIFYVRCLHAFFSGEQG